MDGSRFGVWGWSGGGTNTLNLMTRSKEFKAGIAGAPVTDWHYYDSKWSESFMKTPQANPQGYEKTSLVKRAGDLSGDLLIMYGTYDDNVHPQNEEAFMNALIAAGKALPHGGVSDEKARVHRRSGTNPSRARDGRILEERSVRDWGMREGIPPLPKKIAGMGHPQRNNC